VLEIIGEVVDRPMSSSGVGGIASVATTYDGPMAGRRIREMARTVLSEDQRRRLHRWSRPAWLGVGRRTSPISWSWGGERGTPIGRWYDKRFLDANAADIRGHVLEIRDTVYSSQYPALVTKVDVLDIDPDLPQVTIVGDVTHMPQVASNTYDCAIVTRLFQYLRDVPAAIGELHRVLAPGGVLLCAHSGVPGRLTDLEGFENEFAILSVRGTTTVLDEVFGGENVTVQTWGNVLACIAFLRGVAAEEVGERRLLRSDPYFPQTITARAVKPEGA